MSLRDVAPVPGGLVLRPHPLFVLLEPLRHYALIALLALIGVLGAQAWVWVGLGGGPSAGQVLLSAFVALLARFLWAVADWATRTYGLSSGLVWAERGVLNRRRDELPVDRVRSMALIKPIEQRIFDIGSVGFATAGTSGYEVVWYIVGRPADRLAVVRNARPRLEEAA